MFSDKTPAERDNGRPDWRPIETATAVPSVQGDPCLLLAAYPPRFDKLRLVVGAWNGQEWTDEDRALILPFAWSPLTAERRQLAAREPHHVATLRRISNAASASYLAMAGRRYGIPDDETASLVAAILRLAGGRC